MNHYDIIKKVFQHESRSFKTYIVRNVLMKKDYFLTVYFLKHYLKNKEELCYRLIKICQNIKYFRCCEIFFDHDIRSLKSIRPSNLGLILNNFVVVEPLQMVSLSDYFDLGNVDQNVVYNGFLDIYQTLHKLHNKNFAYGCLSPLSIIVANDTFALRAPSLLNLRCGNSPAPIVSRKQYRYKTELEKYPHDFSSTNSLTIDMICFGCLLCDYILSPGCNLSFKIRKNLHQIDKIADLYNLPSFIISFLDPKWDVFCDEASESELQHFLIENIYT